MRVFEGRLEGAAAVALTFTAVHRVTLLAWLQDDSAGRLCVLASSQLDMLVHFPSQVSLV